MSTGGVLIVVALVIWGVSEGVDLAMRRGSRKTLASYDRRSPRWVYALNIGALILACVGFVLWLTQNEQNFGVGL